MNDNFANRLLFGLSTLVLLTLCPEPGFAGTQRHALKDFGTYTFANNAHGMFLTSVAGSPFIVTDGWRNSAGQKWTVNKGYVYTAYILKPTSEGLNSKVGLSLNVDGRKPAVIKETYTVGMSNKLYWSVIPTEKNLYMLQSLYDEDLCLDAAEPGQPVTVSKCRNLKSQQWIIDNL